MRGSVLDLLIVPVIIVVIFAQIMMSMYVNRQITGKIQAEMIVSGANATDINYIYVGNTRAMTMMEQGLLLVVFSAFIGSIILSFAVKVNPAFAPISIILYAFGVLTMAIAKGIIIRFYAAFPAFTTTISWGPTFWNNSITLAVFFGAINIAVLYLMGAFE